MSVSFNGYGQNVLTFNSFVQDTGVLVKPAVNLNVERCADNDDFIGITTSADGQHAGVLLDGYVEIPYSGSTVPPYGFCALVSDGTDKVKVSTTSKHIVRVIKVDAGNKIVGFIL